MLTCHISAKTGSQTTLPLPTDLRLMSDELTYKDAGVDTEHAAAIVKDIAALRAKTEGSRSLYSPFGLFAAGMDLSDYKHPIVLAACDGVGTKIELLLKYDLLETAGIDLVAMNVNDILTCNGMPLMFLDYIGVPKLDDKQISRLITGMTDGLAQCDCLLAGGETAEMPGIVPDDVLELSGFVVGAAEKEDLLDPSDIKEGDAILAVPSNGVHANGFSLVRRILDRHEFSDEEIIELLAPTRIYYAEVKALQDACVRPSGMAHITGGGIRENFARVLTGGLGAEITLPVWPSAAARKLISFIELDEAIHTFNMGVGWMIVLPQDLAHTALSVLPEAFQAGVITTSGEVVVNVEEAG